MSVCLGKIIFFSSGLSVKTAEGSQSGSISSHLKGWQVLFKTTKKVFPGDVCDSPADDPWLAHCPGRLQLGGLTWNIFWKEHILSWRCSFRSNKLSGAYLEIYLEKDFCLTALLILLKPIKHNKKSKSDAHEEGAEKGHFFCTGSVQQPISCGEISSLLSWRIWCSQSAQGTGRAQNQQGWTDRASQRSPDIQQPIAKVLLTMIQGFLLPWLDLRSLDLPFGTHAILAPRSSFGKGFPSFTTPYCLYEIRLVHKR